MQLKKIKVYGKLRKFLGKSYFKAAVKSPEQAISFLFANYNGLEKHMNDQIYKIKMGGNVITEEFLSISGQGDIQIIPIATGSLPAVVGLIGTLASVGTSILGTTLVSALKIIGTSLVVDGISNLLRDQTPMDTTINDTDPRIRGSYSFSGIQNISSSGVPIPIIYGHVFSGSILISAGVDTVQLVNILANEGTYTQTNNLVTININNHTFINGENVRLDFTSGPLSGSNIDTAIFGVQNVDTNSFQVSTGVWNSQTYDNAGNTVTVTERLP